MSDEPQNESGFVVKDRRRFSSEGELRESESNETAPPKQEPPKQEQPKPTASEPEFSMKEGPGADSNEIDFSSFLLSLATQALMQLGEMPPPDGVSIQKNPAAARQTIDIVSILEEKTRGNLSEHEAALIKEILHNLRLSYVRCTK